MGFWDKVKSFFGGGGPPAPDEGDGGDDELRRAVLRAIKARAGQRDRFEAVDVAADVLEEGDGSAARSVGARDVATVQAACKIVDQLFKAKWFEKNGYSRTWRTDNWVYHPVDESLEDGDGAPSPKKTAPAPSRAPAPRPVAAPARAAPKSVDSYQAPADVLGLSAEELRKRSLKIVPWKTAWIGRVDVIPPASDERTALVDRGLELRGLLTREQIDEAHRVGDLWLKHRDAALHARVVGQATAEEAIVELRRQRAALKDKKKREAKEREERRVADVAERKRTDIIFLGRGVSSRLVDRRAHVERLEELGLPVLSTPADVAAALGLEIGQLRWLAFHADAADKPHYVYFEVPKRSGGVRLLSSPMKKLAAAQAWIATNILAKLPLEAPAHGFVPGRSTVTNATPHLGQDIVVNLDLSDFFPTITFARIRGLFQKMGYSPAAATVLALLVTEPPRRRIEYAGTSYWVAVGERSLPQGACTSPALSNLVARKLDRRLRGVAEKMGFVYTRYADDLTFSAPAGHRPDLGMLLARVRHVVGDEGFALNPKKGRLQRCGGRQTVTGIVVNQRLGLAREDIRRLRALLHAAQKTGLAAQNREGIPHFEAHVRGKIAYLNMIDPKKAEPLLRALQSIAAGAGPAAIG